jgi:hypothetical protein
MNDLLVRLVLDVRADLIFLAVGGAHADLPVDHERRRR